MKRVAAGPDCAFAHGADDGRLLDAGDDPHGAAVVDAGCHVDAEHTLEALRPAHPTALLLGAARLLVGKGALFFLSFSLAEGTGEEWRMITYGGVTFLKLLVALTCPVLLLLTPTMARA